MNFTVAVCPLCAESHHANIDTPPAIDYYITSAKEVGFDGISLPETFICETTGDTFEGEVALYRPYTNIRALDRRAWPGNPEGLMSLDAHALRVIAFQNGTASEEDVELMRMELAGQA